MFILQFTQQYSELKSSSVSKEQSGKVHKTNWDARRRSHIDCIQGKFLPYIMASISQSITIVNYKRCPFTELLSFFLLYLAQIIITKLPYAILLHLNFTYFLILEGELSTKHIYTALHDFLSQYLYYQIILTLTVPHFSYFLD